MFIYVHYVDLSPILYEVFYFSFFALSGT